MFSKRRLCANGRIYFVVLGKVYAKGLWLCSQLEETLFTTGPLSVLRIYEARA
jgi:hypothetical protein